MSKKVIVLIIGIVIIAAIGAGYYVYNKPRPSLGETDVKIDASNLIAEFNDDENAANKLYLNKVLEVHGTIKGVVDRENKFIVYLGDDTAMGSVSCTLNKNSESVAYGLKEGDEVTLKGRCIGFLLDVIMEECLVMNN